jgi:hypothetical protein
MKMQKIKPGQTLFGTSPFTIDNITNNAVILLRHHTVPEFAVMNISIAEAISPYKSVDEFVKRYFGGTSLEDDTFMSSLQALVIGGEFRENLWTPAGEMIIHVHYDLARKSAEEALLLCGATPTYVPADSDHSVDIRMTKKLVMEKGGKWEVTGRLEGLNRYQSVMSQDAYEMVVAKLYDS